MRREIPGNPGEPFVCTKQKKKKRNTTHNQQQQNNTILGPLLVNSQHCWQGETHKPCFFRDTLTQQFGLCHSRLDLFGSSVLAHQCIKYLQYSV